MSMKQFYPLIKEHLLKKPLDFANTFVNLSETNKLPTIQEKHHSITNKAEAECFI